MYIPVSKADWLEVAIVQVPFEKPKVEATHF